MTAESTSRSHAAKPANMDQRLRVLLVPDSVHWITGTIARYVLTPTDWIYGTVSAGPVPTQIGQPAPSGNMPKPTPPPSCAGLGAAPLATIVLNNCGTPAAPDDAIVRKTPPKLPPQAPR